MVWKNTISRGVRSLTLHHLPLFSPLLPFSCLHLCESQQRLTSLTQRRTRQVPGKVLRHVARIVFDAVNERRLAPAQHREPECIQAWTLDDAAIVLQGSLLVDDRDVQPAVIRPKPGRPHDRTDLAA